MAKFSSRDIAVFAGFLCFGADLVSAACSFPPWERWSFWDYILGIWLEISVGATHSSVLVYMFFLVRLKDVFFSQISLSTPKPHYVFHKSFDFLFGIFRFELIILDDHFCFILIVSLVRIIKHSRTKIVAPAGYCIDEFQLSFNNFSIPSFYVFDFISILFQFKFLCFENGVALRKVSSSATKILFIMNLLLFVHLLFKSSFVLSMKDFSQFPAEFLCSLMLRDYGPCMYLWLYRIRALISVVSWTLLLVIITLVCICGWISYCNFLLVEPPGRLLFFSEDLIGYTKQKK